MSERLSATRLAEIRQAIDSETESTQMLMDLLAEVERNRAPDPQEEVRLAEIRAYMKEFEPPYANVIPAHQYITYILERLSATQGMIADLLCDPREPTSVARLAGAAEERQRLLKRITTTPISLKEGNEALAAVCGLANQIRELPPLPDPLPPEASRRRADALADCLRKFVEFPNSALSHTRGELLTEARQLLEGGE